MRLHVYLLLSVFCLCSGVVYAAPGLETSAIVPADYIIAGNLNHELGQRWLKARGLKGQGEFEQARIQYAVLLAAYPHLIQARFEYIQVLQTLGRFAEMEDELELLIELDPVNVHYKQVLGMLFFEHGQQEQGVLLLEDVWSSNPDVRLGQLLLRNYMQRGQKQKALPILEYLYKQSDNDSRLQEDLFVLYIELGDDLKAQSFAPVLSENTHTSLKRLILAAKLHKRLGLDHLAADYWRAVLKVQPDYKEAHENLVRYYTVHSRGGEALPHKIFLYSTTDDDGEIAGEIGDYYVKISECSQAVFFLKRSLAMDPNQVERLKGLAYCYRETGEIQESAQAFLAYFRLQPEPSHEDRLTGAKVFRQADMGDEAAHQYQALLVEQPGDIAFLEALAKVETGRGNFEQALLAWTQVAHRKPTDVACRIQILALSEKLGITDVQPVLAEIHALDQNNHRVSLLLALAAFQSGSKAKGLEIFTPLARSEFFSDDLLALRGQIFLLLNQPEHSFADLSEALKQNPKLDKVYVFSLLQVAGVLGRCDVVGQLDEKYHFSTSSDMQVVLLYADALAECGGFAGGVLMYKRVIAAANRGLLSKARLGLARLYATYDFPYEAEQENRLNWLGNRDVDALLALTQAALRQNSNGDAEYWLDQYTLGVGFFNPAVYLLDLQLLLADEEWSQAMYLAEKFDQVCADAGAECISTRLLIRLDQAEIFLQQGEIDAAKGLVAELKDEFPQAIRPLVFELYLADQLYDAVRVTSLQDNLLQQVSGDGGNLFELQRLAEEYGLRSFALAINRKLFKVQPKSLKYGLSLIISLLNKSSFDEALDVIQHLQVTYPDSLLLRLYGGHTSLAMGEFEQGLGFLDRLGKPTSFKQELLRARLLWAAFKRDEALRVYENNLQPDAEQSFRAECDVLHVRVEPYSDSSLWLRVVKPMGGSVSYLERSFTLGFDPTSNSNTALIGAAFFAKKRWQDLIALELEARKAVRKREYFHAVNQYEAMGDELNEPTLLFDLAGVYSSLNRVGDEAVVYEKINLINPDFPGLAAAMNRNELRRRPRTGMMVQYFEEDGFDGYKDIKRWKQEMRGWYSPAPRQEGFVSVSQLHYDGDKGKNVSGQELLFGVTSNVFDYFKLDLSGGVHLLGDDYPDKSIFNLSITGAAGDFLKSYVGIKRYVVSDTLASLRRGITAEEYTAQATIDLFPRLHVGGRLSFADYSDDNDMSGYSFWGVFILKTQPDYVYFRAGYEFVDYRDGAGGTAGVLADGFRADDHPYWSPTNYWRNQYTLGYRHTYSDTIIGHQLPGFFSAEYSTEYDSEGDLFHHLATGVHLEVSESWLFSFNGSMDLADEYDGFKLDTTLEYRW